MNPRRLFGLESDAPIHALTLKFSSSAIEQGYQARVHEQSLPLYRSILVAAILAIAAFYPSDKALFPNDYVLMWGLRTFLMIPAAVVALVLSFLSYFARYRDFCSCLAVSASGWSMALGVYWYGEPGLMYFTFGTSIVAMFSLLLMGLPTLFAAATTWPFVMAAAAAIIHSSPQLALTAAATTLLLVACLSLTIAAYRTENLSRRLYYKSMQLVEEQEHIRTSEEQRSIWLENMAEFFRHEVRTCIRGIQTSLELLTRRSAESLLIEPYIERARRGIEMIDAIARGVTTATSIESAVYSEQRATFALATLVAEQVEGYRINYLGCEFVYRPDESLLPVSGRDDLFIQLLNNLVANAVDYHVEGTPIVISLARQRDFAVLEVTNTGPLLPTNRNDLFDLFRSFRDARTREGHHGIGLYVVKLIAEGYGGSVQAENLADETGVVFRVAIPCVAGQGAEASTAEAIQR